MDIFQAIILGLIQGLSEFLPISSSGHLALTPMIFNWEDQGLAFDVALHFGTLIAVIGFFYKEWIAIFCAFFGIQSKLVKEKKYPSHFLLLLIAGTIPAVVCGLLLEEKAETVFRDPWVIVGTLTIFGGLLYLADLRAKYSKEVNLITFKDAILIGFAQAIAIIPGTSRSGVTITAALAMGFSRKGAAKFSFLLSTPVIFGATVYKARDIFEVGFGTPEIIGIIVSAVSGFFAIAGLLKFVEKVSYKIFFWYRLVIAIAIALLILGR
ncbi:undecaprenyl-diphosphatase UppP [bacterium]|jgi:undecaprenyl-diphosphatase|nr:undecaprenyl-diphosphatase UppP [bacterium]MBT4251367.1 undecaprenyl-diphosphatase UppP [bacterium]MBT4598252.1 undecaprenyl-diphosphatase UppP [bacterium]MBT6754085.1 undecaprenyl-diphosphatase UppP [bacterium]MBT7037905.1 undecaprenyl-diphosphatase UppP [bacterium]